MGMKLSEAGTIEIFPSILNADFSRLGAEIAILESVDVKAVHLDVMDGHFVENITIGPPVIDKLRVVTNLVFDCHLMISEPEKYAPAFVRAGANHITFHIEAAKEPRRLIDKLHSLGCTAGICLNPETPVEAIQEVGPLCDMVLVMTVHPGFGGQSFIPAAAEKIPKVRDLVGPDVRVEVDGGIGVQNAGLVVSYGCDTLVVGSAIFSRADRGAAVEAVRRAAKR